MSTKGKDTFTQEEVNRLKELIRKKVVSSRNEQKKIRRKIRNIGFYFSDFSSKKGYTVDDLEYLIDSGKISVIDKKENNVDSKREHERPQGSETPQIRTVRSSSKSRTSRNKPLIVDSIEDFDKPEYGLSPIILSDTKFLILGTFPAKESINANFYYENQIRRFWGEALRQIGNFTNLNREERKKLLHKNKIGLWDIFEVAERGTSNQDLAIRKARLNPIQKFLDCYPSIKFILFNGKNAYQWLYEECPRIFNDQRYTVKRLQSSSGMNAHFKHGADWEEYFRNHNV